MTVPEYIYQECRKAGFTKEGCCALLGNIQHESAFVVNNVEDGRGWTDEAYTAAVDNGTYQNFANDGIGYGVYQLTYPTRKAKYLSYAKGLGKSIGDLNTQVAFLLKEMKEDFYSIYTQLRSGTNLYNLTWVLLDVWENPAEKSQNMVRRYQSAQEWYAKAAQLESASGSVSGGTGSSVSSSAMTAEQAIQKVLDLARSEIGYHEKASSSQLDDKSANSGAGNWTKYARDLDSTGIFYNGGKNGYAWCDVFVDWLFYKCFGVNTAMQMLCQPQKSAGAGCLYSAQYYKSAGRWVSDPQPGDQIFFTYAAGEVSHTGIVESVGSGQVVTIEGNTSDQVARRTYALGNGNIYGYGRPKWELASGSSSGGSSGGSSSARILKIGCKGDDVKELQENLIKLGYSVGTWGADGDFGNSTNMAVRKFQQDHKLLMDGEAGPDTLNAIQKALKELDGKDSSGDGKGSSESSSSDTPASTDFKVGDTAYFTGGVIYINSASNVGTVTGAGEVKVTQLAKSPAAKHRYHVDFTGADCDVCGWTDKSNLKAV